MARIDRETDAGIGSPTDLFLATNPFATGTTVIVDGGGTIA
jgi:hypothetical protein